jgi:hypothetical protein
LYLLRLPRERPVVARGLHYAGDGGTGRSLVVWALIKALRGR